MAELDPLYEARDNGWLALGLAECELWVVVLPILVIDFNRKVQVKARTTGANASAI